MLEMNELESALNREDNCKKIALITGASTGIGKDLAILFAKNNYHLVLVARSQDLLHKLKNELLRYNTQVWIIVKDLAEHNSYLEIRDLLNKENISVDVLVNNAGVCTFGCFGDQSLESQLNMIQVNISAVTALTQVILPTMLTKRRGCILNIASLAGLHPFPNIAVYSASKAYNIFFSQALSAELKDSGIKVVAICLGVTKTPLLELARISANNVRLHLLPMMDSKRAAEIIFNSMLSNKKVLIGGWQNKLLSVFLSILTNIFGVSVLRYLRVQ
jgi:short-subunit dehydrogenase